MAKGLFARIFGLSSSKNNNDATTTTNNKKTNVKKSRVVDSISPTPSTTTVISKKSIPSFALPTPPPKKINTTTIVAIDNIQRTPLSTTNNIQTPPILDKEDFFSDVKDKLTDMNDFINTQGNNDIDLYLENLNNLQYRVSYEVDQQSTYHHHHDEYSTLSSSSGTSSSLSLQDALFSHFSNTDTRSEITTLSSVDFYNSPKIRVRTTTTSASITSQQDNESVFDRRFSVADTNSTSPTFYNPLNEYPTNYLKEQQEGETLFYEKQFCNMYIDALRFLSTPHSTGHSSPEIEQQQSSAARAFTLFEFIANKGYQVYNQLNTRTKYLVSFAQYRVGRMLCESICDDDNLMINKKEQQQGLLYLNESSKNGNARASFILGFYAEQRGELDHACQLYHQAAMAGILIAKVAFGTAVLFKFVSSSFSIHDAIYMLQEASNEGHSIASLSLALYYEKLNQLDLAHQYCQRVQIPPTSPIYCVSSYQIGVIYLKAGPQFADTAFRYIGAAAKATFFENGQPSQAKFTTPLRKLGVLSLMGIGTPQSPTAAFSFIQEAAKLGDEPANILLGQMYWMGLGCAVNLSRAMEIFVNYEDNIAAKLSRGLLIMKENPTHAYQEFQDVIRHPTTAFDEEHWDVTSIKYEAHVRIAVWEYNGIGGTQKNPARAFHTLKRLSDECNYSGAHYWLAWAYMDGVKLEDGTVIVSPDRDQAFEYFLKGARQGKADCQHRIGMMLREGYSNATYQKKHAFKFFLEAAKQDYPAALTVVGVFYFSGHGTEHGRDLDMAFTYFSAAAKHNEPLAIQYLADYMIKNNSSGPIDRYHIYTELNRSAGVEKDPIAYRMLALVVNSGIDPRETYEEGFNDGHVVYEDLLQLYKQAKRESLANKTDVKFRFTLHCLWKAIELNDHQSGNYLCDFISKMSFDDISKTVEIFETVEGPIPNKMSIAFAQFLNASKNKSNALAKFIEVAKFNEATTSTGWSSRLEAAKLILNEGQGKARSKTKVFQWLSEMISYNGKNLFIPFILLGKCHENEICNGCTKELARSFYEHGLLCKTVDTSLEVYARMRLVEIYYKSNNYRQLIEQLNIVEPLVDALSNASEKKSKLSDLYYYRGMLSLHNGTIFNYREKARYLLSKSDQLGNILACLELGYLYGTMEGKEELADDCFQKVESSKNTPINFKNRITESMVQVRTEKIRTNNDYLVEFNKMKLAAGITYSYYNMERQALDWFQEISDSPIAQIMILYYKMKDIQQRTAQNIHRLSALIDPYEEILSRDYYDSMAISYGQFRLGQCYQHGHGVPVNINMASDFYNKACVFLLNNETYERLAEITDLVGSDTNLFTTLLKAARNDTNAMFKLGQYYHSKDNSSQDADIPSKKAADYYHEAAQACHAESCYYYAKYLIDKTQKSTAHFNAAARSKPAVNYLRTAANKNHAPSFYELGKLEMEAGLYEEGVEDLEEAAYLNHGRASYELGELYRTGFTGIISGKVTFKISQSASEAMAYYKRAIENNCMLALIRVGSFFETGELGEQDLEKARNCYAKAYISQKCPDGMAEFALGCLEEACLNISGVAIPTNNRQRKTAFDWFQKSLQAKNPNANYKIGSYLLNGWIVQTSAKADEKRGLDILIEENGDGNVLAMKELARYFKRKGDASKAFGYWRNAELLNDPEALEYIAKCFEKGLLGQQIDLEESFRYKSLALEARKQAVETQRSMMGFKSDYSEERK